MVGHENIVILQEKCTFGGVCLKPPRDTPPFGKPPFHGKPHEVQLQHASSALSVTWLGMGDGKHKVFEN